MAPPDLGRPAGGFTQHRLGLNVTGKLGDAWSLDVNLLARIRLNEPGQDAASLSRTFHASADVGRTIGGPWSLHGVVGVTTLDTPTGEASYDPSAWLMLRWAPSPP